MRSIFGNTWEFAKLFPGILFLAYGLTGTSLWASENFYQGKTLRIIVTSAPGGGSDLISRILAQTMSQYIPGKPKIIVQNIPGGGNIIGMNYIYVIAKPDGLTFGHTSVPGVRDQLLSAPGVKFDYRKFDYVGNAGPSLQVFSIRASLPYKSLEDLRKSKKTIFVAAGSKGSTTSVISRILAQNGFPIKAVTGYRGSAPRVSAMLKGEVDATIVNYWQAQNEKESITPLFWIGAKGAKLAHLPNLEELPLSAETQSFTKAITIPVSLARSFLAPPKTDPKALGILQKAFKQAVESEAYVHRATSLNFPVEYKSPEETKALYLKVLDISPKSAALLEKIMGISK